MKPAIFVDKISFNDGTIIPIGHSDIIIFTGANNVGKSQVLKDIDMLTTKHVKGIVVSCLDIVFEGSILERINDFRLKNGQYRVKNSVFSFQEDIVKLWKDNSLLFTEYFKNRLNTELRLHAANNAPSFNSLDQEPSTPVQRLYLDDKLECTISRLFHDAFDEYLIINRVGGNTIPIHVGQPPEFGPGEDRVSQGYLEKLRLLPLLQDQGDGMRSFAGILFEVFTTQKTITMVDEPEAFLHPPQARLLGRMLVNNKPNNGQLFISTHSEDFIKGILDADSDNVKIIRLDREGIVNPIKVLNNNGVKQLWKDSILRYSNILSGLFHTKVVICESDTDCQFYQAIMNALYEAENLASPDVLFTHCGGKERFKVVIPALKALNVKTIVVADFDVLDNETTFKSTCDAMGITWDEISANWKSVYSYVASQRAQLNTKEARESIIHILNSITTPQLSNNDIDSIRDKLRASTAWAKVKEVGKSFFLGKTYTDLDALMSKCRVSGLFIVPVGELECFYKPAANKHGTSWVNVVMDLDLANEPQLAEARAFVKEIISE